MKTNNNIVTQQDLLEDQTSLEEQWAKLNLNNNGRPTKPSKSRSLKKKKSGSQVLVSSTRTKSLTDEDLDELKGCVDLGFGFSYDEIPELCNTLPALELCYSMSQKFIDDQHKGSYDYSSSCGLESSESDSDSESERSCLSSAPVASWKISSPGDHPEDVKARLKYWAQAVACTVKLCS